MKFRADFVTNSSSSSYLYLDITSPLLAKMMKDYEDVLVERGELPDVRPADAFLGFEVDLDAGYVGLHEDETGYSCEVPENLEEVLPALRGLLSEGAQFDAPRIAPLLGAMIQNEAALRESIESVSWGYTNQGWGGDHEGRFYPDSMPKDFADSVWEDIAAEKGVSVEDLTDDDWVNHVSSEVSIETWDYSYNRKTGEEGYKWDYSFL